MMNISSLTKEQREWYEKGLNDGYRAAKEAQKEEYQPPYMHFQPETQVLTYREIYDCHEFSDHRGWMDFARDIESMTIRKLKAQEK